MIGIVAAQRLRRLRGIADWLLARLGVQVARGRIDRAPSEAAERERRSSRRARRAAAAREADGRARIARQARAELTAFLSSDRRLACPPEAGEVDVSVVIVVWNQPHLLFRCLRALIEQPAPSMEVILVDNGSGVETARLLGRLDGFRLVRNASNLGFLRACNQGARAARGRALLLLNSDAFVRRAAVTNALAALESEPGAGAVGGRLILASGQLQEAGCVVWADGTTSGCGRGLPSETAAAMVRRDVDYCSGAFLMTPRRIWEELHGFDEAYVPAYYEEADYCMRLRHAGHRVIFEPSVAVDHFERGSERKSGEALKTSRRNLEIFRTRHAEMLRTAHVARSEMSRHPGWRAFQARDRVGDRRVLLIVDHYTPEPDQDAGSNCMLQMITLLTEAGFHLKFWPQNLRYVEVYATPLEQMGVEVFHGDVPPFHHWLRANRTDLDAVIVSRPHVAEAFLPAIRRARLPAIYLGHDIHADRMSALASLAGDEAQARAAAAMRRLERRIWRSVDLSLYFSDEEVARVRALEPRARSRRTVPYGFDTFDRRRAAPAGADILFVAGFAHPPNEDAAEWLVAEILPRIRAQDASVRLRLVGSHPTSRVLALAQEGVAVTGHVSASELEAHYRSARLAIVPLRVGAGVKLKVVEALRYGLPLLTTSVGAQGLADLVAIASVADDPAEIAAAAVRLIRDDAVWISQSLAQSAYAQAHFSREEMKASYLSALELAGLPATRARAASI